MNTFRRITLGAAAGLALLAGLAAMTGRSEAQAPAPGPAQAGAKPGAVTETAIFAGGCFWCVESDFDKVPGVLSTTSGYTGGKVPNPTYQQVSADITGHAEVVQIVFDPTRVSYAQLVEKFWRTIDPTVRDRQFCDVGTPYRTAIFATSDAQFATARASLAALEKSKPFKDPIVTPVERASTFYPAEEYHQDYYKKNPVRYNYYRTSCGRDARLKQLWGSAAP
ncbi:MAG: peptide-methionine (S)-S-oxide reductase MsrA [Rubrivivax sp.]|nr:peptide-methionine (S)-S-oxide reductase MsrA [Rubrivivax sp.]